MTTTKFDLVISGGGLSGSLMALSLASLTHVDGSPLTIAIIEATAVEQSISTTFDDRVLALSHGSASYLQQLGVWHFLKEQATAITNIHVSDRDHYGKTRLTAKNHGVNALGYVVEMSVIGKTLYDCLKNKAKQLNNITWFTPDSIDNINWQAKQVNIELKSQQRLSCSLLLACDGGNSVCRQLANIDVSVHDYHQSAVIANVSCQLPHLGRAFERFTEHGPLAMLPMTTFTGSTKDIKGKVTNKQDKGEGRCSLVWTLPPEQAITMAQLSNDEFARQLEQHFGTWLGAITQVGKRHVYPLQLIQAKQQTYHRMALVGNASHAIHPIAGQGFNLGVRDVSQMADLIKGALINNKDIGSLSLLTAYSEKRSKDLQQVITITDSLVTLFSNQLPPLVAGRNIGLKMLNYLSPLKNAVVKKMMGY